MLHDVGKISIPKEILNKPAALTGAEFEVIKTHTIEGQFMLDRVGGLLGRVGEIVRSCHERWDGRGYPDGLMGEEIPLAARIVFACDAYNAMTTDRPYRNAMSSEAAVAELVENAGTQFDPSVVDALTAGRRAGRAGVVSPSVDGHPGGARQPGAPTAGPRRQLGHERASAGRGVAASGPPSQARRSASAEPTQTSRPPQPAARMTVRGRRAIRRALRRR